MIFFISALAETNRPPFDLAEAESELVAGYQVEYSSTLYLLIYLSEMANIIMLSGLISVFFFGGWEAPFPTPFLAHWNPTLASLWGLFWFVLKTFFWFFMFAMARAIVPRYRYDQLMRLGWKIFLPDISDLGGASPSAGYVRLRPPASKSERCHELLEPASTKPRQIFFADGIHPELHGPFDEAIWLRARRRR